MTSTPLEYALAEKARGRFRAARLGLEPIATRIGSRDRARYLAAYAELLQLTGDGTAAIAAARRVRRASNAAPDCRARSLAVLATAAAEAGEVTHSLNRFQGALKAAREAADPALLGWIRLEIVGNLADSLGPDATGRLIEECTGSAAPAGHPQLQVRLHLALAAVDTRRARPAGAAMHLRAAEELLATNGNHWLEGLLALGRAGACVLEAAYGEAARHSRSALGHAEQSGHLQTHLAALASLARTELDLGNVAESEVLCQEALALAGGAVRIRVGVLDTLARVSLHRGRPRECRQRLAELDRAARRQANFPPASEVLASTLTRARLALTDSAWQEALEICENDIARADEADDLRCRLSLRCLKADACRELGNVDEAARALAEARGLADDAPLPLAAEVRRAEAALLGTTTSWRRARAAFESSLRILSTTGGADARRDGGLGYLRAAGSVDARVRQRLAVRPWDLAPVVGRTLPRRSSRSIPTRGSALPPSLHDLAPLARLASHPALLAEEMFVLLRDSGCVRKLAIVSTRGGSAFEVHAREGWPADAVATAARRPGRATTIPCGEDAAGELRILLVPADGPHAPALVDALKAHAGRLVAPPDSPGPAKGGPPSDGPPGWPGSPESGIFASPAMRRLVETARKAAPSRVPILIVGESGTGKEVLARLIHRYSGRAARDFVPYNCTGAPRDVVDSQLFGHRRGAFTGAYENAPGLVRAAGGGTLLLDEVGELDLQIQPKLLRLLENNEVQPLGETRPVTVDVRVIAATNADPEALVRAGGFRKDLLFRLNAVRLDVPPLRERRDDIPPLAQHFLRRYGVEHGRPRLRLAERTLECLLRYEWPGNVRQLSNEMRRAAALADDRTTIAPEHLSPELHPKAADAAGAPASDRPEMRVAVAANGTLAAAVGTVERAMIERALRATDGRVEDAARLLGLSRKGLFLKRRRLGIHLPVA